MIAPAAPTNTISARSLNSFLLIALSAARLASPWGFFGLSFPENVISTAPFAAYATPNMVRIPWSSWRPRYSVHRNLIAAAAIPSHGPSWSSPCSIGPSSSGGRNEVRRWGARRPYHSWSTTPIARETSRQSRHTIESHARSRSVLTSKLTMRNSTSRGKVTRGTMSGPRCVTTRSIRS